MYGTQDASATWQETYTELLQKYNIQSGAAWPSIFYDRVHGDDFVVLGDDEPQAGIEKILAEKSEFRVDGSLGPDESDGSVEQEQDKSTPLLRYEPDPRHAEIIVQQQLNLKEAKGVNTPSVKETGEDALKEYKLLNNDDSRMNRSLVMRAA